MGVSADYQPQYHTLPVWSDPLELPHREEWAVACSPNDL